MSYRVVFDLDTLLEVCTDPRLVQVDGGVGNLWASCEGLATPLTSGGSGGRLGEGLLELLESGQIQACIPESLVALLHYELTLEDDYGAMCDRPMAQKLIHRLLGWVEVEAATDCLEAAHHLSHWPAGAEFYDGLTILFANDQQVEFLVVQNEPLFHQLANSNRLLTNARVQIISAQDFVRYLRQRVNLREWSPCSRYVYVRTPQGDYHRLFRGATPIDFAYKIHSDVGNQFVQARISGQPVSVDHRLESFDVVDIETDERSRPQLNWLLLVAEKSTKQAIKRFYKQRGRKIVQSLPKLRDLERRQYLRQLALALGISDVDHFLIQLGSGQLTEEDWRKALVDCQGDRVASARSPHPWFGGIHDCRHIISGCCNPLPGAPLVGLLCEHHQTVQLHHQGCKNLSNRERQRAIPITWAHPRWQVVLRLKILDYPGSFESIQVQLRQHYADIDVKQINGSSPKPGLATATIEVPVTIQEEGCDLLDRVAREKAVVSCVVKKAVPIL